MREPRDWPMDRERLRAEMQMRRAEGYTTGVVLVETCQALLEERDQLARELDSAQRQIKLLQVMMCE